MLSIYITYFSSICSCYQHTMCDKTKVHLSMLVNPVNHTYQNYYSRLAHILFPLGSIFTYQTDALPSMTMMEASAWWMRLIGLRDGFDNDATCVLPRDGHEDRLREIRAVPVQDVMTVVMALLRVVTMLQVE